MKKKDFISLGDFKKGEIVSLLALADKVKHSPNRYRDALKGKSMVLIFQKPSCRTRVSFEVGMYQLGGSSFYLAPDELRLGKREAIRDVAATLSRYVDVIVARTYGHEVLIEMAQHATIPVINGLTDLLHPCQALADLFTIKEKLGRLVEVSVAYIGDGNNVCHSLMLGASKVGLNLRIATPKGFEPSLQIIRWARQISKDTGARLELSHDPRQAATGADVLYTDVWASMGQEKEAASRRKAFRGFQINQGLLELASPRAIVMHCLPAHRGEEITDEVMDGPRSCVFEQAENRLHTQKAVLLVLLNYQFSLCHPKRR